MKEAITYHASLSRVQRDLKALQVTWKSEKANALPPKDLNLLDLLPGRENVDHLVHLYFDTFETVYRILHAPTFWSEYHSMWEDLQAVRPAFVVTTLLMMAAVNCISPKEESTYIGDSATSREVAILWIESCELWLQCQSQKHVYLAIWQIRVLLLLSKITNTVKKKRTWTLAGNLMRQAAFGHGHSQAALAAIVRALHNARMDQRAQRQVQLFFHLQTTPRRGPGF